MTEEQLRQIHAWWQVFQHGGELTEIRIVGKYTDSGYYKDINNLIRDVEANEHKGAVYFTINPPRRLATDESNKSKCRREVARWLPPKMRI